MQKQSVEICPNSGVKKPFVEVTDLEVMEADFCERDIYLLQWAQQQNNSFHLCCRKLKSWDSPVFTAEQFFKMVGVDYILELNLSQWWLKFTAHLFLYLGLMRNNHICAKGNLEALQVCCLFKGRRNKHVVFSVPQTPLSPESLHK